MSADWQCDISVDSELHSDIVLEACTQVLEKNIKSNNKSMGAFIQAWPKSNNKDTHTFNTYKILINAGYHHYAENLRKNFKKQNKIDLKDEPIKA